jgi:hypothetical protein
MMSRWVESARFIRRGRPGEADGLPSLDSVSEWNKQTVLVPSEHMHHRSDTRKDPRSESMSTACRSRLAFFAKKKKESICLMKRLLAQGSTSFTCVASVRRRAWACRMPEAGVHATQVSKRAGSPTGRAGPGCRGPRARR